VDLFATRAADAPLFFHPMNISSAHRVFICQIFALAVSSSHVDNENWTINLASLED
jgi:hypothetical protein